MGTVTLPRADRIKSKDDEDDKFQIRGWTTIGDARELILGRVRNYWSKQNGWLQSAVTGRPVDGEGHPVPWICYPCRRFLEGRVQNTFNVFEYGSGHSTLWWSTRVRTLTSCEHAKSFYNEIKPQLPESVKYLLHEDEASYVTAANDQDQKFDVIVVDGNKGWRAECGRNAVNALTPKGVIVWDNTNLAGENDLAAYQFLRDSGFRQIEFWGHGPIWVREWPTSIFYRSENCLGI